MPWSVATVIPASKRAQAAAFRPELDLMGKATRLLVDQIGTVDARFIHSDPVHCLDRNELAEVEHAVRRYLGL